MIEEYWYVLVNNQGEITAWFRRFEAAEAQRTSGSTHVERVRVTGVPL